MKRIPLRIRLMLTTSLVLFICCFTLYFCVQNSAIMQLDSIQSEMLSIQTSENCEIMNISLESLFPDVVESIVHAKADFTKQSILITFCVILIGSLITFFSSTFALRPVSALSREIADTTEHNLYVPLSVPEAKDEIRQLTESFNHMRSRLAMAFSAQKQFSANAAHELRTPLAVMQTSLEVFRKKKNKTPQEYEEALSSTLSQIDRMNHLVNTLLSFQTMHSASLDDTVCISALADEIDCDLTPVAEKKSVTLNFHTESSVEIRCNETLIYQAIYNLVENAIKYNHNGGIVDVCVKDTENGVLTTITDNGQGIPEDQWEKIFDAFYRIDKSRSREFGGAGLGLAMVKEIALLHNGRVWIKESSTKGTAICLLLPLPGLIK